LSIKSLVRLEASDNKEHICNIHVLQWGGKSFHFCFLFAILTHLKCGTICKNLWAVIIFWFCSGLWVGHDAWAGVCVSVWDTD
jgi:hypothetical protein